MYKLLFGLVFLLISYAITALGTVHQQQLQKQTLGEKVTVTVAPTANPTTFPSIENLPSTTVQTVPPGIEAKVDRVVDGDTIQVILGGGKQKVRLIGINTPETVDPRRPVQCFGKEASNHAKEVLTGKTVYLESDPTQDNTDKYKRLLRYVWLDAETNFNKQMIVDGYAYEYTYNIPYKYQLEFKSAQKEAENARRGLWSSTACAGGR